MEILKFKVTERNFWTNSSVPKFKKKRHRKTNRSFASLKLWKSRSQREYRPDTRDQVRVSRGGDRNGNEIIMRNNANAVRAIIYRRHNGQMTRGGLY